MPQVLARGRLAVGRRPVRLRIEPAAIAAHPRLPVCVDDDVVATTRQPFGKLRHEQFGAPVLHRRDGNEWRCDDSDTHAMDNGLQIGHRRGRRARWRTEPRRWRDRSAERCQLLSVCIALVLAGMKQAPPCSPQRCLDGAPVARPSWRVTLTANKEELWPSLLAT